MFTDAWLMAHDVLTALIITKNIGYYKILCGNLCKSFNKTTPLPHKPLRMNVNF